MPSGYLIVEDKYLGEFSYSQQRDSPEWGWLSRAYFCAECGEVWARRIVVGKNGKPNNFLPYTRACRRHVDPWGVAGSLLADELAYSIDSLSAETLAWELDVHLTHYERQA